MTPIFNSRRGFTIIEILVVLAIMMLISSMGFAGFYAYSRSQAVEQTAQDIKIQIEKAKFSAESRVKPSTCVSTTTLSGYQFSVVCSSSPNFYSVAPFCSGVTQSIQTFNLPSNLSFGAGCGCTITFGTQANDVKAESKVSCGTSGTNVAIIKVTGFTFTKTINVDNGGNVTIQ